MYSSPGTASCLSLLLSYLCYRLFRTYRRLKHIPGPFWARFTNLQRVSWVRSKRAHEIHTGLHHKYGDCVRFGPNMVSISDPAAIAAVYPMRPGFPKSDFYRVLMPYTQSGSSLPVVFNTRDETTHKQIKNPIAPMFSLSSTVTYEVFVDQVLEVLFTQLDQRYVHSHRSFDLGNWLQYFAFDVMGTLTFSKRYGFLEQGRDVNGMLASIWDYMTDAAPFTQIPWLDTWWRKNRIAAALKGSTGISFLKLVAECINERQQKANHIAESEKDAQLNDRDMLSRFLEVSQTNEAVPSWAPTAWTFSNVIAGSDSTGVVLKTIMYNLLAHPSTLSQLYDELIAVERTHALTRPFPTWAEVCDLPYLDACINEGVRLHPPFCLPLERVVPREGIIICKCFFAGGTVVGISPWVVNRHRPTFGEDADVWRPERWLGLDTRQRKKLENSVLTFGAGRRICLGRNIALLELKKLVSALVLNYEVSLRQLPHLCCSKLAQAGALYHRVKAP
ncbi:MAG: hypothetical protein Q9181_007531 [Wetmoreana brouardii]